MSLTLGFIAFFISIIIPGIVYRRFFFFGEFSKQFNTKDPVLHSIFFSIIPGIIIQVITFVFYYLSIGFDSSFLDVFVIFRDVTSDGSNGTQDVTKNFISNYIITFFIYSICVFLVAAFLGWISSRFIRARNWDKKYKLFRFSNQWYYIFSGEVLNLKKFEEAHQVSFKNNKGQVQDTLLTYADILVSVSEQNDRKELYTGYVVDYDLKREDITQLDKIYLIDTYRYKKQEKCPKEENPETGNNKVDNITKSRNRLKVPGDIFVLKAKNIVNLNLTYIPSIAKKAKKEARTQKKYSIILKGYIILIVLIILTHFFYRTLNLEKTFLVDYLTQTNFFGKLIVILFLNHLISFGVPFANKDNKLTYDFTNIKRDILTLVLLGGLSFWFALKPII